MAYGIYRYSLKKLFERQRWFHSLPPLFGVAAILFFRRPSSPCKPHGCPVRERKGRRWKTSSPLGTGTGVTIVGLPLMGPTPLGNHGLVGHFHIIGTIYGVFNIRVMGLWTKQIGIELYHINPYLWIWFIVFGWKHNECPWLWVFKGFRLDHD